MGKCPRIATSRALRPLLFPSIYAALDFTSTPQGFMTIEKRRSRFSRNYLWTFGKDAARIYDHLAVGGEHFLYPYIVFFFARFPWSHRGNPKLEDDLEQWFPEILVEL